MSLKSVLNYEPLVSLKLYQAFIFLKAVLDAQQNLGEATEIFHIPPVPTPIHSLPPSTSPTRWDICHNR